MGFRYKQVLVIGGTSGIGAALGDRLVQEGSKVIIVGRRQDRIDTFVQKHGSARAGGIKFNISDLERVDEFFSKATEAYPDIDCVFLNAGTVTPITLAQPENVKLEVFHSQMMVNFTALVDITMKFLPFLMSKKSETSLIYTSSNIAFVPAAPLSAYSASKAALNAFILCLRDELRYSTVKVVELSPPMVQTELNDYMGPEVGRKLGMPIDIFTGAAYEGIVSGKDQIVIGSIGPEDTFNEIVDKRRTAFENFAKMLRGET